jgi:hypothetical protein
MVNALGGLTQQNAQMVIFYQHLISQKKKKVQKHGILQSKQCRTNDKRRMEQNFILSFQLFMQ